MIPIQHTEEVLSVSYVKAVVSQFGYTYECLDQDYGTDGCIRRIKKVKDSFIDLGTKFDCQLKATMDWEIKNGKVIYDMKSEAYNRLVIRNNEADIPCLLILLCLPKDKSLWMSVDTSSMQIRNCCYYSYLKGDQTTNTSQKRIMIPERNIFNIDNLTLLFADFNKAVANE